MPERKILGSVLSLALFVTIMISAPALPNAFAHGGHQPPPADFGGKKASLLVSLDPLVVTTSADPVFINAWLYDEDTNAKFREVTYRVFFKKDGNEIPILTEVGQFGGQVFFYDPEGKLQMKVVPKNTENAVARGAAEALFG